MRPEHTPPRDVISVVLFFILLVLLVQESFKVHLPWYITFASIALGYILADGVSGFVHFLGDTVGSEKTPLIGKSFIYPFREHHIDERAITRHNFFITNGNNCLVSLPVMVILLWFIAPNIGISSWMLDSGFVVALSLIISVFATNQIHKWAHMHKPPKFIRTLQRLHIILPPKHHAIHHIPPHKTHFCITTGWLNALIHKK